MDLSNLRSLACHVASMWKQKLTTRKRFFLEKLIAAQLVQKFDGFYGSLNSTTVFKRSPGLQPIPFTSFSSVPYLLQDHPAILKSITLIVFGALQIMKLIIM